MTTEHRTNCRCLACKTEKRELNQLLPAHDAGLSLEHNQHRSVYDTAEQWIAENDWCDWESDEAKREAIEIDSIWTLQWYPDTPVGFYAVAAPTLADLLRIAANAEREANDD